MDAGLLTLLGILAGLYLWYELSKKGDEKLKKILTAAPKELIDRFYREVGIDPKTQPNYFDDMLTIEDYVYKDPWDNTIFNIWKRNEWPYPVHLIKAIIYTEWWQNTPNPEYMRYEANVSDWSVGLMQIRIDTAKWLGHSGNVDDLKRPAVNIFYGAKYLDYLWRRYSDKGTNIKNVLSAYNGGHPLWIQAGDLIGGHYANDIYVGRAYSLLAKFKNDFPKTEYT